MDRHMGSEHGLFGPLVEENESAIESLVSIVSRSAGVVLLVAAVGAIASNFIF